MSRAPKQSTCKPVLGSLPANLYLFDERNRAFLEYRSIEVYPYRNPLVDNILALIIPAIAILCGNPVHWLVAIQQRKAGRCQQ